MKTQKQKTQKEQAQIVKVEIPAWLKGQKTFHSTNIVGEILAETDKAIKLQSYQKSGEVDWLPKSQIEVESIDYKYSEQRNQMTEKDFRKVIWWVDHLEHDQDTQEVISLIAEMDKKYEIDVAKLVAKLVSERIEPSFEQVYDLLKQEIGS